MRLILSVLVSILIIAGISAMRASQVVADTDIPKAFVTATLDKRAISVVVKRETTDDQLKALIYSIRDARRNGHLYQMIPPTTPGGASGDYGIVWIFIFSDTAWATKDKLSRFVNGSNQDQSFLREFIQHVRAEYYYSSGSEYGSIGCYDSDTKIRSRNYIKLF